MASSKSGWVVKHDMDKTLNDLSTTRLRRASISAMGKVFRSIRADVRAEVRRKSRARAFEVNRQVNFKRLYSGAGGMLLWVSSAKVSWERIRVTRPRRGPIKVAAYRGLGSPLKGGYTIDRKGQKVVIVRRGNRRRAFMRPTFAQHIKGSTIAAISSRHMNDFPRILTERVKKYQST